MRSGLAPGPSEGRTAELEVLRGESQPLQTATGFVIGGMVCGLFWTGVVSLGSRFRKAPGYQRQLD
jgi:hypothetical protein